MTQVHTPLTAPTPSTPSAWYSVEEVTVISPPDGVSTAWGILTESNGEFLRKEDDATHYWLAQNRNCALSHVLYLNGHTNDLPVCTCQ